MAISASTPTALCAPSAPLRNTYKSESRKMLHYYLGDNVIGPSTPPLLQYPPPHLQHQPPPLPTLLPRPPAHDPGHHPPMPTSYPPFPAPPPLHPGLPPHSVPRLLLCPILWIRLIAILLTDEVSYIHGHLWRATNRPLPVSPATTTIPTMVCPTADADPEHPLWFQRPGLPDFLSKFSSLFSERRNP